MKLLKALKEKFPTVSGKTARTLIKEKKVFLNDRVAKISDSVEASDTLHLPEVYLKTELTPNADLNVNVLKEDDDFLFIEKPIKTHSVAQDFSETQSLANWLMSHNKNLAKLNPLECGLCHRLDFETSGVMAVAKDKPAYEFLRTAFQNHQVQKIYECLVSNFTSKLGEYKVYVSPQHRSRKKINLVPHSEDSKALITQILSAKTLNNEQTLLTIQLITGFRHQIRAHLDFLGYSLLGDTLYGGKPAPRLMLHAKSLGFEYEGKSYFIESNLELKEEF